MVVIMLNNFQQTAMPRPTSNDIKNKKMFLRVLH